MSISKLEHSRIELQEVWVLTGFKRKVVHLPGSKVVQNMEAGEVVVSHESLLCKVLVNLELARDEGQSVDSEWHREQSHKPPRYVSPPSHPFRLLHLFPHRTSTNLSYGTESM
jgi:hypothetical protein